MTSTTDDILALHNEGRIAPIVAVERLLEDGLNVLYPHCMIVTEVTPREYKTARDLNSQIVTCTAITADGVKHRVGIEVSNDKRYAERSVFEAARFAYHPEHYWRKWEAK